jgi:hypothetical protein
MTQILAPMFITVAEDLYNMPENIDVIITIKKTAKVIPTSNAANFPLSFTNNLYAILRIPLTVGLLIRRLPAYTRNLQDLSMLRFLSQ